MFVRILSLVFLLGLLAFNISPIFYFNIYTHSLPQGIYMKINGIPHRGDYAATCLTKAIAQYGINRGYLAKGNCETGTVLVLKIIRAVPGDTFRVNREFLQVNGESYRIIGKDSSGRVLSLFYRQKNRVLGKQEYLLLSNFVKNSWDSRYWGPVTIKFLLKPLVLFENVHKPQIPYP